MGLPSSGYLSINEAAGAARSIAKEVTGSGTGNNALYNLGVLAGKDGDGEVAMSEFYNYSSIQGLPKPYIESITWAGTTFTVTILYSEPDDANVIFKSRWYGSGSDDDGNDEIIPPGSFSNNFGSLSPSPAFNVDSATPGNTTIIVEQDAPCASDSFEIGAEILLITSSGDNVRTVTGLSCDDEYNTPPNPPSFPETQSGITLNSGSLGTALTIYGLSEAQDDFNTGTYNFNMTFEVYAEDVNNNWTDSGITSATSVGPPAAPANLDGAYASLSWTEITWSWDDMQGAGPSVTYDYQLYQVSNNGLASSGSTVPPGTTSKTFTGLGNYSYRLEVLTKNSNGSSAESTDTVSNYNFTVSPSTYNYGTKDVGSTTSKTFTYTAHPYAAANDTLNYTQFVQNTTAVGIFSSATVGALKSRGQTGSVVVDFDPTSETSYTGNLGVHNTKTPNEVVPLSGTGEDVYTGPSSVYLMYETGAPIVSAQYSLNGGLNWNNYSSTITLTNITGTVSARQTWNFPSNTCPGGGSGQYLCGSTYGDGDLGVAHNGGPPDQNITWTLMNIATSAPNMYFTSYDFNCN